MNILKQMLVGKTDGQAHYKFIRYGKGEYERFLFEITKGKNNFKVKSSYDFANDFVGLIAEHIRDTASVSGKIIMTRDFKQELDPFCEAANYSKRGKLFTAEISADFSPEQLRRLYDKFSSAFLLLNIKSSEFSLKSGKSLPKPGGQIKPDFCSATLPLNLLDEFVWDVKQDFQKLEIKHILQINEIVIPTELKAEPAKARLEAKRKGKIIRLIHLDGKEIKKESDLLV